MSALFFRLLWVRQYTHTASYGGKQTRMTVEQPRCCQPRNAESLASLRLRRMHSWSSSSWDRLPDVSERHQWAHEAGRAALPLQQRRGGTSRVSNAGFWSGRRCADMLEPSDQYWCRPAYSGQTRAADNLSLSCTHPLRLPTTLLPV